jgi:membrane protein DedA with SNARE-associated domain
LGALSRILSAGVWAELDLSATHLLAVAGHSPALQALAIILATFILEDAATAAAALAVQDGAVAPGVALGALYVGIVLGDIGLYGLGRLAAHVPWAVRLIPPQRQERGRAWLERHVFKVVFISRFLPGVRLPTYTSCGFLGANFRKFVAAAVGATLIWTSLLFAVSMRVGRLLVDHLGEWRWVGFGAFLVAILLAGRLAARAAEANGKG